MSETAAPTILDIQRILEYLPHRYPLLLVDRMTEVVPKQTATGYKNVTINESFFQGHYPGKPIMPGVLILEAMAQVGCVLVLSDEENLGKIPLVAAIEGVRFKRPVVPGDRLQTRVEAVWLRKEMGKFRGDATVDGELVATAEIVYKLITRDI